MHHASDQGVTVVYAFAELTSISAVSKVILVAKRCSGPVFPGVDAATIGIF